MIEWIIVVLFAILVLSSGIRIVRPTERGLIERLGKYRKFSNRGFNWIIPMVDKMVKVNITEQMIDAQKQEIITKDRLNATVDAQVYFKVKEDEGSVMSSQYNVNNYKYQIVNLAKTTLRNIIGNLSYDQANSDRNTINKNLQRILEIEAKPWGIQIVRTELKEIEPTDDVQGSMNEVIKAENTKKAAIDVAQATETTADGLRRATIKEAEGKKRSIVLEAEADAKAIEMIAKANAEKYKLENVALQKYFIKAAVEHKQLQTVERALKNGTKYVIDPNTKIQNVISDFAGNVIPIKRKKG